MAAKLTTNDLEWDESGILIIKNPRLAKALQGYTNPKPGEEFEVLGETDPVDLVCRPKPQPIPDVILKIKIQDQKIAHAMEQYVRTNGPGTIRVLAGTEPIDLICRGTGT